MTDNDIKKSLECCKNNRLSKCHKCPAGKIYENCSQELLIDALDYINRLEAENEDYKALYEGLKAEHIETIKAIKYYKAEAYKKFAERLKEDAIATFNWQGVVLVEEIDNLLKEMVGE